MTSILNRFARELSLPFSLTLFSTYRVNYDVLLSYVVTSKKTDTISTVNKTYKVQPAYMAYEIH